MPNHQYLGFVDLNGPILVSPSAGAIFPVALFDGSGNPISSSGGALNVNATFTGSPTFNGDIVQWNSVNLGSPSAYGTSPGAVSVIGVNAFVTNAVTVNGSSVVGSLVPLNAVMVGARDNSGNAAFLRVNGISGALVVSGSVTVVGDLANNNTPAINSDNLAVLPAVANASHPVWGENNQVLLSEDLSGNLRTIVSGTVTVGGTVAVSNFPASQVVTLASTTITGSVAVTGTFFQATQPVSGTVTANQGTSPWVVSGTVAISGTVPVTLASTTITGTVAVTQSTSPWVVSLASTTVTNTVTVSGAVTVTNATAANLKAQVSGALTNNVAAPAATLIGVMPALANTTNPSWIDSRQVLLSVDLSGNQRVLAAGTYNTTIPAPAVGPLSLQLDSVGSLYVNHESRQATYSASALFVAAAGDIAVMPGSATKTIRVTRVEVSLSTSGTAAIETIALIKRSTADSAGTSGAMGIAPHDNAGAAATAAPLSYTVAPTLGTAVATIRQVQFADSSSASLGSNTWLWTFGDRNTTAIVLHGVAQQLCVNLGGAVATQTALVSFEWVEI